MRNEDGRWIAWFARRIGVTTSFVAELWGASGRSHIMQQLKHPFSSY